MTSPVYCLQWGRSAREEGGRILIAHDIQESVGRRQLDRLRCKMAGPDGSFGPVVDQNTEVGYRVRILAGSDIWHRGCAFTELQTVQSP